MIVLVPLVLACAILALPAARRACNVIAEARAWSATESAIRATTLLDECVTSSIGMDRSNVYVLLETVGFSVAGGLTPTTWCLTRRAAHRELARRIAENNGVELSWRLAHVRQRDHNPDGHAAARIAGMMSRPPSAKTACGGWT